MDSTPAYLGFVSFPAGAKTLLRYTKLEFKNAAISFLDVGVGFRMLASLVV